MHWTIGRVKITKVVELETVGSTRFILPLASNEEIQRLPWLIPHFATEQGRLKMSIHSLVIETPSRRIVVDTGLGNDKEGRKVPTWNNRKDPFLDRLTAAGFAPDSIDTVLCTHLHVDHVGWNTRLVGGKWLPTFANARYVFGKTEYEHWRDHSDETDKQAVFNDSVKPVVDAGKADLVASDARICDEITLISIANYTEAFRRGTQGVAQDLRVLSQPWGFQLAAIGVPTSVHHGEADTTVPAEHARLYAEAIPGAQLHLHPGHGHFSILTVAREMLAPISGRQDG